VVKITELARSPEKLAPPNRCGAMAKRKPGRISG
jgi:hypothetical protein